MAEQTLVRRGMWLAVPDGVDDVTAAAVLNPGMAAWKTLVWEGELTAGQSVLVLGATATSGRIAAQGPYDLIIDYLWGAPPEAVFTALIRRPGGKPAATGASSSCPEGVTAG